jgi:hypothetical protein
MQIYIAKSGQQTGPFSIEQLKSMLNSGMIALNDSAWHDGLVAWQPLHQVLNIAPPTPQPPAIPQYLPDRASTKVSDGVSKLLFEGEQILDWSYPCVSHGGKDVSVSELAKTESFVITNKRIIYSEKNNSPGEYALAGSDLTCINLEGISDKAVVRKYQPNTTLGVMLAIAGGGLVVFFPIALILWSVAIYCLFFGGRIAILIPGGCYDVNHLPDVRVKELLSHIKSIQ